MRACRTMCGMCAVREQARKPVIVWSRRHKKKSEQLTASAMVKVEMEGGSETSTIKARRRSRNQARVTSKPANIEKGRENSVGEENKMRSGGRPEQWGCLGGCKRFGRTGTVSKKTVGRKKGKVAHAGGSTGKSRERKGPVGKEARYRVGYHDKSAVLDEVEKPDRNAYLGKRSARQRGG